MDLQNVRWFLTVAACGHVTRAATELRISQPGLSRAIARLERELGAPLFDREGRAFRLSRYGEIFREHAERLIAAEEAARRALAQAGDPDHGEIGIAFLHTQGARVVPDLIRGFRATRPHVTFRLSEGGSERIEAAVADGRADMAITSPRPEGLAWHPLSTEGLCLAVPTGHRLARHTEVNLAEAAEESFVVLRPGFGLRSITEELFRASGIRPRITFEGEETTTVRGLVAAGLGVAVVPPSGRTADVVDVPITGARRTIGLAWVDARTRLPAVEEFRRFVIGRAGLTPRRREAPRDAGPPGTRRRRSGRTG